MLLEVKNLKTYFYTYRGVVKAVDDINLRIERGKIVGIVGESGSGKTVTALSILRLIRPPGRIVGGEILFEGENLLEKNEEEMKDIRGKSIAIIFQDPTAVLDPMYTVGYQVGETLIEHQKVKDRKKVFQNVVELFKRVRLPYPEVNYRKYPHEFSGGMRQRVVTAIALSCYPKLLICDEATTNLDVTIQARILQLLVNLKKELDTTVIFITHDLSIVAYICDSVAVMYAGKIVEYGDVYTIFERPAHPYTLALLKSLPKIGEKKDKLEVIPGNVPDLINPPAGCRFHPRCRFILEGKCDKNEPNLVEIEKDHVVACYRRLENIWS